MSAVEAAVAFVICAPPVFASGFVVGFHYPWLILGRKHHGR
jgi:hypothetical protein